MRVRISKNGEFGSMFCSLGDVPILRLLQDRCPNLRIEVILGDGKRNALIALADLGLEREELLKINDAGESETNSCIDISKNPLDNLAGLGRRSGQ